MRRSGLSIMAAGALLPVSAMAADAPAAIDTGHTAWLLISPALVLMMTVDRKSGV